VDCQFCFAASNESPKARTPNSWKMGSCEQRNGILTKRASASIRGLSSPPSHLDIPQPIGLWISQDAVAPIAADLEVLGASHSAILIWRIVRTEDIVNEIPRVETYVCA
jgi:hypothetical protein